MHLPLHFFRRLFLHRFPAHSRLQPKRLDRSAFSLVEVTIAIGVMAFGLMTMLALVPVGLDTMRESREEVERAQLVQRLTTTAQQTPFSRLQVDFIAQGPYYFTAEGAVQGVRDADTRFIATPKALVVNSPANPLYPGSEQAGSLDQGIFVFGLTIETLPGANRISKYVSYVSNQGN